jgi:hypothetical protein
MVHDHGKPEKEKPLAGPVNTQPRIRIIDRAMGKTNEVAAILREKLIANEIKRCHHMPAAVDIRMEFPFIINQKPIDPMPVADQTKLLDCTWLDLPR